MYLCNFHCTNSYSIFFIHTLFNIFLVLIGALNLINQQVCWNEDVLRSLRGVVGIKLVAVFKLVEQMSEKARVIAAPTLHPLGCCRVFSRYEKKRRVIHKIPQRRPRPRVSVFGGHNEIVDT